MSDNVEDAPYSLEVSEASIFGRYYLQFGNDNNDISNSHAFSKILILIMG